MSQWRSVTPWAGAAAFLVACLAWLGQERQAKTAFEPGSALDTSPEGVSLAQRYLVAQGRSVRTLSRPLDPRVVDPGGVVFRVRPARPPFRRREEVAGGRAGKSDVLTPPEAAWVRGGGRLVLALDRDYGRVTVKSGAKGSPVRKVFPAWPRVRRVLAADDLVLADPGLGDAAALFVRGDGPVISRARLGRGDVVLLTAPRALDNAHLALGDHLELLHALAGRRRIVYFDEYVHGLRTETGLLELLAGWGLGPALASLGLLCAAAFWRGRARLGPPDPDPAEARSEAVDLVDSLAQLYDRTIRREEAVRLYLESLRKTAALKTGLRGAALEARVKGLLGGRPVPRPAGREDLDAASFQRAVSSINEGFRRLEEHAQPR